MNQDLLQKISELKDQAQPFVLATVVRAERPTSAKPGAKALITAGGTLIGWIGGSCAEPTVKHEARKALQDGQPRLLRLCPPEKHGSLPQEGVTEVTLACISGGTLEIFIEPVQVQPHLIVVGHLAVAQALAGLGKELGFSVSVLGLDISSERFLAADRIFDSLDFSALDIKPDSYIVVASHGNYDEDALEAALRTGASYVALVASKTRAQAVLDYLRESSLPEEILAKLKFPAGLDIGAITPEEIALSILAEIVQLRRTGAGRQGPVTALEPGFIPLAVLEPVDARDPVCGMMVEIATARYFTDYDGQTYYFCAKGCQRTFEAEPERFINILKSEH